MLWSKDEARDAQCLTWIEFHTKYPQRSRSAWRKKIVKLGKSTPPVSAEYASDIYYQVVGGIARHPLPDVKTPLYDAYAEYHKVVQHFVLPRTYNVSIPTTRPIAVVFMSDMHIGGEGTDMDRIREDLELIARTPRVYLSMGGDVIDNFILKHMSHAAQESDIQVKVQWRIFAELMQIVREKVIMVGSGNHDAWTWQAAQIDGILAHLKDWPTVYTGEGGLIHFTVGKQTYQIYRKHTPNRSRSRKHPTNTVVEELMAGDFDFDLGIMEHQHNPAILQFLYRGRERLALRCGTYKTRDNYSESIGYTPEYGVPTVIFSPDAFRMQPFWSIQQAIDYLGESSEYPLPMVSKSMLPEPLRRKVA